MIPDLPTKFYRTKHGYEPVDWPMPMPDPLGETPERTVFRSYTYTYPAALTGQLTELLAQNPGMRILPIVEALIQTLQVEVPKRIKSDAWREYHATCVSLGYTPAHAIAALRAGPFASDWIEDDRGRAAAEWRVVA